MGQPFIGEIRMAGFNFAPVGWSFCDGSTIAISQNEALFQLIGTTYGGDGVNTFNLPDLRGRIPLHQGTDNSGNTYVLGQRAGTETVTVLTSQLPPHNHPLRASKAAASQTGPGGNVAAQPSGENTYIVPTNIVAMSSVTTATGGSQPHDNLMPFLTVNFILSLFGVFPSQG